MKAWLICGLVVVVLAIAPFVVKLAWACIVPDIFTGAVAEGLVTPSLTVWQALKIVLVTAILSFRIKLNLGE